MQLKLILQKSKTYFLQLSWKKKGFIISSLIGVIWFANCLPDPLFNDPVSIILEDKNGQLLGGRIAKDGQWRFPLIDSVPGHFKTCITEFEDKRFDDHIGIDPLAIARAFRLNIGQGRVVSGGSTISMQVIRLSRKGQHRTYLEKIIEVFQALRLEMRYSKKEILQLYATYAPFGGNVVGLETAAWKYFGRAAKQLSWAEHATLAVLPNRPSIINPSKNRDLLKNKRNQLLNKLYEKGHIDSITHQLSLLEALPKKPKALPSFAPHLLDTKGRSLRQIGGRIKTNIDLNCQVRTDAILNKYWHQNRQKEIHNIAAIITEVESGEIIGYVGNVGYFENKYGGAVDMIPIHRSTGSIIKPLLYASALEDGSILPQQLLPDIPTYYGDYAPQNFDKDYSGAISADEALINSLNVPIVRMLSDYGQPKFYNKLKSLGFSTLNQSASHYGLSLILGGAETSLKDLSKIYTALAKSLLDNQYKYTTDYKLSPGSLYHMFEAMSDVKRPGIEFYWKDFNHRKKIAWKTGTSFGSRDAWAVGITPKYVVTVWVGNASGEGRPSLTGTHSAGPVLFELFDALSQTDEWFKVPYHDMHKVVICKKSGLKAGENCTHSEERWIPKKGAHTDQCHYHKKAFLDPYTKEQVTDKCMDPFDMEQKNFFVLPPAQEWYYKRNHPEYEVLPSFKKGCQDKAFEKVMEFIYPKAGIKISMTRDLDGKKGTITFEAKHREQQKHIYWHIDDEYVGSTQYIHELNVEPSPGKHTVTIIDEDGEMIKRKFELIKN